MQKYRQIYLRKHMMTLVWKLVSCVMLWHYCSGNPCRIPLNFTIPDPPEYIYIPGGLRSGASIIIRGKIPFGSEGFSINLKSGDQDDSNIAFHFNPRTDDNVVVRNSRIGGDWQDEERDIPHFPFQEGRSFQIRIHAHADEFRVSVNGTDFINYGYRVDVSDIVFLQLHRHAEYSDITIQNSFTNPYFDEFPRHFGVGQAVRIRGAVKEDADNFVINFSYDSGEETVGLHINPRFDEEAVIRNSKVGDWQDEERDGDFPFARGQMFDMLIIAQEGYFDLFVNETKLASFNYRCDVEDINFLSIKGDISLCDAEFLQPLPNDFLKDIPSGLETSDMIIVRGFFYPEGQRFDINLMNGTSLDDDVGLHFNPRRNEAEVVLNNRVDGEWLEEERIPIPNVFHELIPFTVKIVVKSEKFKIYVNGKKLTSFRSRCSVDAIKRINVKGDAWIYQVKLLRRLDIPYVERIPGDLQQGGWVVVHGTAKKNATSFAINMQCGNSTSYGDDVAFHFNPRFEGEDSIRNTLTDGDWGDEEQDQPNFPFEAKDAFEVAVNCLPDKFKVYVNGYHYIDYSHRIEYDRICHLMLTGDANFFEPEFF